MNDAIGYTRISEKDQSNNSLPGQQNDIIEYCRRNDLTLHKVFTENGRSAFTFDRPEWLKLEAYIKENRQIKYLIVAHIDRFSRANLMDALIKLHEIEEKLKVKVLSVSDRVDQNSKDLGVQLLRTMNLIFSNNERNRIQERVKDGVYRSYASGRFCNAAPYGYENGRDPKDQDKPLLKVNEKEAAIVRKIFKLYKQGMAIEAIKTEVKKDGFRLRGNSAIQHILSNPVYAGIIKLPAYKGNPSREVNAIHAPIISKIDYYSIQHKLNKKTITIQPSEDVPLRGVLHCHCGRKMTAGNSRGRHGNYYWYYKCSEHRKDYSAKKLHEQFRKILDIISFDETEVAFYRANLVNKIEEYQNNKGGKIMRSKLDLQKIQKKIDDTQTRYLLNPEIDAYVYSKAMTELKAEESRLHDEVSKSKVDTETMVAMLEDLLPKLLNLSEIFFSWPLFRQQLFIGVLFSESLSYYEGIYRTPFIHPMFASKALLLKESGLLVIEQPAQEFQEFRYSTPDRNASEPLHNMKDLYLVFVA